jgi:hypothetical protein
MQFVDLLVILEKPTGGIKGISKNRDKGWGYSRCLAAISGRRETLM